MSRLKSVDFPAFGGPRMATDSLEESLFRDEKFEKKILFTFLISWCLSRYEWAGRWYEGQQLEIEMRLRRCS